MLNGRGDMEFQEDFKFRVMSISNGHGDVKFEFQMVLDGVRFVLLTAPTKEELARKIQNKFAL
jgi:hypothetical protein